MDLLAAIGDFDWIATTDRNGVMASTRGFLEGDAADCVDGAVGTANGSIAIEIEVEVGFKGNGIVGIGINPVMVTEIVPIAIEIPGV